MLSAPDLHTPSLQVNPAHHPVSPYNTFPSLHSPYFIHESSPPSIVPRPPPPAAPPRPLGARRAAMRLAALTLVSALLAGSAAAFTQPYYPIRANVTTKKITNQLILSSTIESAINIPGRMLNGTFQVNKLGTPTNKIEVKDIGCLETVIPPPLNWGPLYCPGREVKVMQYVDAVGTLRREIDIPVQVTANMVLWMFSPLFPQFLEFKGKMWFWYHLWHPFDHIMAANTVGPSPYFLGAPGLYTLIHEHYRNTKAETAKGLPEWESDAWFHVEDLMSNFLKKRIVISINTAGMQAWSLIVNMKDTKEGLKIDLELLVGIAAQGYDPKDPSKGVPLEAAQLLNDNLLKPALEIQTPGAEFMRSCNAITRHAVEEFSMFRFFLPEVWSRFPNVAAAMDLADGLNRFTPPWNYGALMKLPVADTTGLVEMLTPFNRTRLFNLTAAGAAGKALPAAVARGAGLGINARLASLQKAATSVFSAMGGPDAKTAVPEAVVRALIPSAAGGVWPPAFARARTNATA
ncbi:MAG: hypothetical protein J3K34DRAFT_127711 [Monoraphidium minutum]|nr:MAG: hypothetical protein J3K34DRAFT_127711 [Monoraphidium minutum]